MPRKIKLSDKLRKFFNIGNRGELDGPHTPSTGTLNGDSDPSASTMSSHTASPASKVYYSSKPSQQVSSNATITAQPPRRTTSNKHMQDPAQPIDYAIPDPLIMPANSNESGSTNPTRSIPMQQAASQFQQSSTEQQHVQLEHVVGLLSRGSEEQKVNAAELIFNLTAENEHVKEEIALLNVIEPLVALLRTGSNKGKMYAAYTLSSLTSSDSLRLEMQQHNVVSALVSVLADSSRQDVRKGSMRALGRLARCDDAACSQIVDAGGLAPMLALLSTPDNSLVRRCLIAIYFIGADKPHLQLAIANAGIIPQLLLLCKSESQDVQAESVDVIKMLARNHSCGQLIAEAGGLEILGQLALAGQGSRSGQSATRAIQRLYENPKLKQMMRSVSKGAVVENGGDDEVQQLVDIVTRGDRWIREKAVQAIETVAAEDPTVSKELADCGVVEPLVELLKTGNVKERITAARALGNMAVDPYVRQRIIAAGAVPLLLADVCTTDQVLQECSLTALERLLEDVEGAAAAAEERCVPTMLHLLAATSNPNLQRMCLHVLHLACHSQGVAKSHLLENGGVELLVRICWQGAPELQQPAAMILKDLAAHQTTHGQLIADGAVIALTAMTTSAHKPVADVSMDALDSLTTAAQQEVALFVQAEERLQQQVSAMLEKVRQKVDVGGALEQAFRLVPRGMFVPDEQATQTVTYTDRSIVVAHLGISMITPHLESMALESLQLGPGMSFLEAGSGSGFTTCMAAYLLGESGSALGIELDPNVCEHSRRCCMQVATRRLLRGWRPPDLVNMDVLGLLPGSDRWDRILLSVSCPLEVVQAMVGMLKPGGRLVAPCDGNLLLITETAGLPGAQVLARNAPYRPMTLPSTPPSPTVAHDPQPPPLPFNPPSGRSSHPSSSASPHISADHILAPSTPSEGSSHAPQEDDPNPPPAHTPDSPTLQPSPHGAAGPSNNGGSSPLRQAMAAARQQQQQQPARPSESRIPSSSQKQKAAAEPMPPVGAPQRPAAPAGRRTPAVGGQRMAGSPNGVAAARGRAGSAAAGGSNKALVERMDSHLGASPSGADHGGAPGRGSPSGNRGVPNGVVGGKKQHAANGRAEEDAEAGGSDHMQGFSPGVNLMRLSDIQICRNAEGKKCRLGEGGFGVVYKALMNNVDEVAVKLVKNDNPSHKETEVFTKEVAILSRLHHRNIVQFYGACLQPGSMFFVTELMKGGDLYTALRNHPDTMRWEHLGKKVALDVALGINYLHSQKPPMMHRDLKSPNVLLSEEGVAKIADVGMVRSQVKDLVTAQPVMTPLWAAPEVMRHERASIKADIWSYGILIWELVSGEDITEYQPLAMSMQMGAKAGSGKVMHLPPKCPAVAQLLFKACCQMDADQRPTAQQLVEWLRNDRGEA